MSNSEPTERAGGVREALDAGELDYFLACVEAHAGKFPVPQTMLRMVTRIRAALSPPAAPAPAVKGSDFAGDITPHDDKARGLAVIEAAYDWDIADDGTLCGLVAGDHGWASTHIRVPVPAPALVTEPAAEAVATVVWYDPNLDDLAMKPRRVIDGNAKFMSHAALGTKLYAHPPAASGLPGTEGDCDGIR